MKKRFLNYILILLILFTNISGTVSESAPALNLTFSHQGGLYSSAFPLSLSANISGAEIYYTLNNTDPDPEQLGAGTYLYSAGDPIVIKNISDEKNNYSQRNVFGTSFTLSENVPIPKCMIVKAIAKTSSETTPVTVNSYIVDKLTNAKYDLPVISLTTDPVNLYDPVKGLFSNFELQNSSVLADYEKPFHMEYYDENGKRVINQNIGARLHGNSTKNLPQKTLRLYARSEYDNQSSFSYEMFPWKKSDSGSSIKKYKRLLLRNSGNDFGSTMIRDAFNQILVRDLNVDIQEYRPAIAYVCGEFYGLVNIRERYDNEYCAENFSVNKDDIVLLNDPGPNGGELDEGIPGDEKHYVDLHRFVDSNDMNIDSNLNYVNTQFDLDNLQDYYMVQNYIANTDWPVKNTRIWRSKQSNPVSGVKGADGRWRYMICDTDISTDIWKNPVEAVKFDAFDFILNTSGGFPANKRLFQKLMTSNEFKTEFIARYVKNINTTYNPGRVKHLMDLTRDKLVKAVPYMDQRYHLFSNMYGATDNFMTFYRERGENILAQISQKYNMGSTVALSLYDAAVTSGSIFVDGMQVTRYMLENGHFSGKYFKGLSTALKAVPNPGFIFVHWKIEQDSQVSYNTDPTLKLSYENTDIKVTPVYKSNQTNNIITPVLEEYPFLNDYELVGDDFDNHIRADMSSVAWQGSWSSSLQIRKDEGTASTSALYINGTKTIAALRQISPYTAEKWAHVSFDAKLVNSSKSGLKAALTAYGVRGNTSVSYTIPDAECLIADNTVFDNNSGYVHFEKYMPFPGYADIKYENQTFIPSYFKFEFTNQTGTFLIDNVHVSLLNAYDPLAVTPTPYETAELITETPSPSPTPTPTVSENLNPTPGDIPTPTHTITATPKVTPTSSPIIKPSSRPTNNTVRKKIPPLKVTNKKITAKTVRITGACKTDKAIVLVQKLRSKKWLEIGRYTVRNKKFAVRIKKQKAGIRLRIYAQKKGMRSSKMIYRKVRK